MGLRLFLWNFTVRALEYRPRTSDLAKVPRLPFWFYLTVGLFFIAAGFGAKLVVDANEDSKAEALLRPPPEVVRLDVFDKTRDVGAGNEIHIRAQVAPDVSGQIALNDGGDRRSGTFFGLFPVSALDTKRSISALLLSEETILDQSYLDAITVGQGAFGPIIEVNGALGTASNVKIQIQGDLEAMGRTLPSDVTTFVPFLDGRDVALRPNPDRGRLLFLGFGLIGGIYVAYGFLRWFLRARQRP